MNETRWEKKQERPGEVPLGPNQSDLFYLLTVEVQDRKVPGSLSEPGMFQGPGETAALLAGGSSGHRSPAAWLLFFSLSWRLGGPSPPPFRFTVRKGEEEFTVCRPFLSQQGEQISLRSPDLPAATALGGKARSGVSPPLGSPNPWGGPCPLTRHFCSVDLPPAALLTELWSVSAGALSAAHTLASRWSRWGDPGAEAGWDESNGLRWGSTVTSCRAEWAVERESQGPAQSTEGWKSKRS